MSVELHFNNQKFIVKPGKTLFDYAEKFNIRVPTSCNKQGKCKECLVEILEGAEHLSKPTSKESHLKDNFRLSCRTRIINDSCKISCNTMRRGNMKIENKAISLPSSINKFKLDPAVKRNGKSILLDGKEIDQSTNPLYGLAIDLGTTTVVVRLLNLETGKIVADSSFENPQRFGGSDVMARIHYDTGHKGKLLQRTLIGYLLHAI